TQNNEVEIKIGNERITIGVRNKVSGKMERQEFLFPLHYENKLQCELEKNFTIDSYPLLYRYTLGCKIANTIFEKVYNRI
ncbi:pentapeptide repeat-containing protein, partial [Escherichia coli]|nr:pentapeptide repeat-containing protein [Escherichia coli]